MNGCISEYIKFLKTERKLSTNTLSSYETDLKKYSLYLKENGIDSIINADENVIQSYIKFLLNLNMANGTISRKLSSIKGLYRFLTQNHIISDNPVKNIKSVRINKQNAKPVSRLMVALIINLPNMGEYTGIRDRAVFEILCSAGMRTGEIANLKVCDVDFKARSITCGRGAKRRVIPMRQKLFEILVIYMKYSRPKFGGFKDCEFFMLNKNGRGFSRQGIWKLIKRYTARIPGAIGITPDKLRQSFTD